jgi:hypothetical protein
LQKPSIGYRKLTQLAEQIEKEGRRYQQRYQNIIDWRLAPSPPVFDGIAVHDERHRYADCCSQHSPYDDAVPSFRREVEAILHQATVAAYR